MGILTQTHNGLNFLGTEAYIQADGSTKMTIKSDGKVGIGTSSPAEKLDVAGTARMDTGVTEGVHYVGTGLQHWGDGGTGMNFPSNDNIDLSTSSTTRIRVDSSGKVGIGTTSPTEELSVSGDANVTGSFAVGISSAHASYNFYNQGTAYFNGNVTVDANLSLGDSDVLYLGAGNDLQIYHNGSHSWITDNGTGNLWIGGQNVHIGNAAGSEYAIKTVNNAQVELFYDNSKKIETTSAGVTVTGAITATGDITAFSDERLKEDIKPLEDSLEKVQAIEGVSFVKKDDEDKKQNIGFIAQQLKEVLPEVVHENEDGMHSVAYGNITALLVEAVKEQQDVISQLEERIINLENRL